MEIFEVISKLAEETNGIITTKRIEEAGISRTVIKSYVDSGELVREGRGIYSLASELPDEYKILQMRSEKIIFSYGTALYLWGMSDRTPHYLDVTVPQGYNMSKIKKDNPKINFHYVQRDLWNIGITQTKTALGNSVNLYDKERCICDVILMKKEIDKQIYIQAIKEYFKTEYNSRKIIKYAKIFGVEDQTRDYLDILT